MGAGNIPTETRDETASRAIRGMGAHSYPTTTLDECQPIPMASGAILTPRGAALLAQKTR
jgi:hypothetical protein